MKAGWQIRPLGEIAEILDSQRRPVTKSDRKSGPYPYYGASGVQDYVDSFLFDGRFLLVGEDGAKWGAGDRSAYIIEGKSWVNNHAHILKPNDGISDKYIEYFLVFSDLSEYITGAVVPKLTQKALCSIPIPVPPRAEQQRIVDELDLLTSIIDKKNAQLQDLDALTQSIFYEMFGDPISNEKGWPIRKFGELCNSELGKMLDSKRASGAKKPYLCTINVLWDKIDLSTQKMMLFEDDELDRYSVKKGDLLICEGGDIGRAAIYDLDEEMYYQNSLHRVRFNEKVMCPQYMLHLFRILKERGELNKYGKGQTIQHIVKKALLSIPVLVPDIATQHLFVERLSVIHKDRKMIEKSLTSVENLFQSRMNTYFSD